MTSVHGLQQAPTILCDLLCTPNVGFRRGLTCFCPSAYSYRLSIGSVHAAWYPAYVHPSSRQLISQRKSDRYLGVHSNMFASAAVALLCLRLFMSAAAAPLEDFMLVPPAQMSLWRALLGAKRHIEYSCPRGYKGCSDVCVPVASTCCEEGTGSYCKATESCTPGGCCPMWSDCCKRTRMTFMKVLTWAQRATNQWPWSSILRRKPVLAQISPPTGRSEPTRSAPFPQLRDPNQH